MGATCPPPTWKLWERRPPPTLNCRCRSFIFLLVFARELGSLPKNSGPNPGSFSFWIGVTLDPGRRLTPNFKVVPASMTQLSYLDIDRNTNTKINRLDWCRRSRLNHTHGISRKITSTKPTPLEPT